MTYVYIAQLKCSANHCVLGACGEFDSDGEAQNLGYTLGRMMGEAVQAGVLRNECGICKATDLHIEIGRTKFRTLAEAEPFLKQSEADQAWSREFLKRNPN